MFGRRRVLEAIVWLLLAVGGGGGRARAAGVEHPDVGTVALGRAGAFAANPYDGFAMEYNPAGFADQRGWRLTFASSWSAQGLTFAPAGGGASVSNGASPFWEPGGAISYGFGPVGPLLGLTIAGGATGPSAIGRESYPANGAQRYALIASDFFIVYYSAAIAAKIRSWLSAGVTLQFVHGTANFSQAVYSGLTQGTDPNFDSLATVNVTSGWIPTGVFGVTVRPVPRVAVGASYRPHFTFSGDGTLVVNPSGAGAKTLSMAANVTQEGNATGFKLNLADVFRVGTEVTVTPRAIVEADVVVERWSPLETIEIQPHGIAVNSSSISSPKPLPDIVFPKNFETAFSVRVGGEYQLLPRFLTVRAGYLHETSAIPISSTNVDFGNWEREMVAFGASFFIPMGRFSRISSLALDVAYAHHFLHSRTVTDSTVAQVVTPCASFDGCMDTPPSIVGNGTYSGSMDVIAISLRGALDARGLTP